MMSSSSSRYTRKTPSSTNTNTNTKCGNRLRSGENGVVNRKALSREKRLSLQQDVEKLRKKLRHEENIKRAMKRAFNRPIGTLPRLPPSLPQPILELLAEVAVLEEEIVWLEEQIVHCEKELNQEAAFTSSSIAKLESSSKTVSSNSKESESPRLRKPLSAKSTIRTPAMKTLIHKTNADQTSFGRVDEPNRLSEELVKCLSNIFMRVAVTESQENDKDPYEICSSFVDVKSSSSLSLIRQLKYLLERLSSVSLQKLNQQEKLAFWINIYNCCIIYAFLEHGIPESPEMMVTLMQKATINVGGHSLTALTIQHFILRLPYYSKSIYSKGSKENEIDARNKFGLEFSEPLVKFVLSCGSWSSPAEAKREYIKASAWYKHSHEFAKDIESLLDWICLQFAH